MTLWLDAHLSPRIARWLSENFKVNAFPARDLNLREAEDEEIFFAARKANAIILTKDSDFIDLLARHGGPPKIIWLTCGNTSEESLKKILLAKFSEAIQMLESGDDLIEIGNL
jgi:predicted nuclease of predicted toxin-antitoxin system